MDREFIKSAVADIALPSFNVLEEMKALRKEVENG